MTPPDVDIGYKLLVGTTVTFVSACVVVVLRAVARILYASLGWDDYMMLFAVVSDSSFSTTPVHNSILIKKNRLKH